MDNKNGTLGQNMKIRAGISSFPLFFTPVLIAGCFYHAVITTLDPPIEMEREGVHFSSTFDRKGAEMQSVSIGEELFVIRRMKHGERYEVTAKTRTGELHPFPVGAKWTGTHRYDDEHGTQYTVYTTPAFYNGDIGVILDSSGNLATDEPLIQVDGKKKGRRWDVIGRGKFIQSSVENVEAWALRYSGRRGETYIFEIVDKHDANVSEIIQSIHVSESDFLKGFTVKDVFVRGASVDQHGVVKYSFKDIRTSK